MPPMTLEEFEQLCEHATKYPTFGNIHRVGSVFWDSDPGLDARFFYSDVLVSFIVKRRTEIRIWCNFIRDDPWKYAP